MSNVSKRAIRWQWPLIWALTVSTSLWLPVQSLGQTPQAPKRQLVEIITSAGKMIVALYNETPAHRDNFLQLVDAGAYDSLLFHRVIPGFAIEGGDPESRNTLPGIALGMSPDTVGMPEEVVPELIHTYGTLAAAPAGDTPDLAGRTHRQRFFFVLGPSYSDEELTQVAERNAVQGRSIAYSSDQRKKYATLGGQPRLDGAYTVFGEIVYGSEVLDALKSLPCNQWDRPLEDQRMFMRRLK